MKAKVPTSELVVVKPYDAKWIDWFKREAAQLSEVLQKEVLAIHHIGSTAVPGLCAKPIVDVMPIVRDLKVVDELDADFLDAGFIGMGEYGIKGRRYFMRLRQDTGEHRTHVHIFPEGHAEIERHLGFRDHLRTHPDALSKYQELKLALAARYPEERQKYQDGKVGFIESVLKLS